MLAYLAHIERFNPQVNALVSLRAAVEGHRQDLVVLAQHVKEDAAELLRTWLIKSEKGMLVDFLNQLGISHDNGVADNFPETVDDAKLTAAIDSLLGKYPQEKVVVYLNALGALRVVIWQNLVRLLEHEARLQLQ